MDQLLVTLVLTLVVLLVISIARNAIHRSRYSFTQKDLERARQDAARGSQIVKGGQIAEQLAPLLPGFCDEFNPKDARFLGHPIDFVIFDGLEEGAVREVVFVEIKSGESANLNGRQRQVRRAIDAGAVRFETIRIASMSNA
ncbi:MAG: hypothetical protein M3161_07515 [Actinomycetota bacterium]|nr:hypothetical protein [Actinomycetota bacterium]